MNCNIFASTYYINRKEINIFVVLDDYLYLCSNKLKNADGYDNEQAL